jgi:hypothetical protein
LCDDNDQNWRSLSGARDEALRFKCSSMALTQEPNQDAPLKNETKQFDLDAARLSFGLSMRYISSITLRHAGM